MGCKENEITVRTSLREELLDAEIVRARKAAAEFFGKCKATQRGLVAELDTRLRPELAPEELRRGERLLRSLTPGHHEGVQGMLA